MLFGFDISSMSGVLGTQAYKQFFGHPASFTQGIITASMPAGSLAGALSSAVLADRFSRKVSLQLGCLLWMTGSAVQSAAVNIPMLCVGRALAGLCVGIASSVVPIYQSEIAPKEIRGRAVSLHQWAITWGILMQFFVQYGVAESVDGGPNDAMQSTAAFRIPWAVQAVPGAVLAVGLFWYYIVYVMESAGIGSPLLTASIQYVLNVLLTIPAMLYLDRWEQGHLMDSGG
ncbi:hypothetical protein CDD80_200 [Ophiocordyceps camponoti-rufipedis]|uniref:Major facilitator superfamily (MFS) profile domain-containing protein n=1 Tax=Ophiocordyceps camponoti-rufipedis TaxID=2004952 RepID=A0A2C5YLJ7_9HYPO|nr:hypothetical protein CDD80_200 [Ophiocordyceps camponoti-rufipedis]